MESPEPGDAAGNPAGRPIDINKAVVVNNDVRPLGGNGVRHGIAATLGRRQRGPCSTGLVAKAENFMAAQTPLANI